MRSIYVWLAVTLLGVSFATRASAQPVSFGVITPEIDPDQVAEAREQVAFVDKPPPGRCRRSPIPISGRAESRRKRSEMAQHARDHLLILAMQQGATHVVPEGPPQYGGSDQSGWMLSISAYLYACPAIGSASAAANAAPRQRRLDADSEAWIALQQNQLADQQAAMKRKISADAWRRQAPPDMASRFLQLADEHMKHGEVEKAEGFAQRAHQILVLAFGDKDAETRAAAAKLAAIRGERAPR